MCDTFGSVRGFRGQVDEAKGVWFGGGACFHGFVCPTCSESVGKTDCTERYVWYMYNMYLYMCTVDVCVCDVCVCVVKRDCWSRHWKW